MKKARIQITLEYDDQHTRLDELTADVIHSLLSSFPDVFFKLGFCDIEEGEYEKD